ncbi:MAG: NAD-dependent protein deacylase [Treponema sp.]|nr:NAD-dependent protein deacylase [Candidatus Treponema equi]
MEEKIEKLQNFIDEASRIVFFGGAGVSTESGIPDFRSVDGLYNQKWAYPPETIISNSFFRADTKEFYRFYKEKLLLNGIKPNKAHLKLAEMEKAGKLIGVVTQNIDGLHQAAGSKKVWELHGSVLRNYCMKCGEFHDDVYIRENSDEDGIPRCRKCGGLVKPDVVLYEEPLNDAIVEGALNAISSADLLIIGGTSLTVYPAAGMIRYFKGNRIVLINRDPTQSDSIADLVIHSSIGEVLSQITL